MLDCIFSDGIIIIDVHDWDEYIRDETEETLAAQSFYKLACTSGRGASSKGMGGLPFSGAYFLSCTSMGCRHWLGDIQVPAPEAARTLSRRQSASAAPSEPKELSHRDV